jgi:uncharacterized protein (TIGR02996 family)
MARPDDESNPELEAAIRASPDQVKPYLVYADWLQARGNPRGELIVVQHQRLVADAPELEARERELLARLAVVPAGAEGRELSVTWRLGFMRAVRVGRDSWDSKVEVGPTLRHLLTQAAAREVERLTIGLCGEPGDTSLQEAVDVLTDLAPASLRELFLGDFEYPDLSDISGVSVGDLDGLGRALPRLERLRLRGGSAELGRLDFPNLREFTFETGGLSAESITAITRARWPALERLELWFGDENYGAEGDLDSLQPLLDATGLPALRHLGLVNSGFIGAHLEALARSTVLPQLRSLDLSRGTLDDVSAETLRRFADRFRHLEHLDVTRSYLTPRGMWLVRQVVPGAVCSGQQDAGPEDERYVAVGE